MTDLLMSDDRSRFDPFAVLPQSGDELHDVHRAETVRAHSASMSAELLQSDIAFLRGWLRPLSFVSANRRPEILSVAERATVLAAITLLDGVAASVRERGERHRMIADAAATRISDLPAPEPIAGAAAQ